MGKYTDLYGQLGYGNLGEPYINPILKYYVADNVPPHSVNLGYIDTDTVTASGNINVINSLSSNVVNYPDVKYQVGFGSTTSGEINAVLDGCPTDYVIISNKYSYHGEKLKYTLWYRHKCRAYAKLYPNASVGPIKDSSIIVEAPDGKELVSNNLLWRAYIDSVIDGPAGVYECSVWTNFRQPNYTINYTSCHYSNSVFIDKVGHTEKLNAHPAYFQGNTSGGYVYKASMENTTYRIEFKTNRGMHSVWFPMGHQFDMKMCDYTNVRDNWYVKVGRGTMLGKVNNQDRVYKNHAYYLEPFETNMMPLIRTRYEKPEQLSYTEVAVVNAPIYCDSTHPIVVTVDDRTYTTKTNSTEDFSEIIDYDSINGIIILPDEIKENSQILVSYFSWELYASYRGYTNTMNNFMHIDFNPNYGHFTHYRANATAMEDSNKLIHKSISMWLNPNDYNNVKPNTSIYHSFNSEDGSDGCPYKSAESIKIGSITINGNVKVPRILDGRRRGGGIKEDIYIDKEAEQYWDIGFWEGKPYQSNGCFIVDINNNQFKKEYILDIIDRYKAAGTLGLLTDRTGI